MPETPPPSRPAGSDALPSIAVSGSGPRHAWIFRLGVGLRLAVAVLSGAGAITGCATPRRLPPVPPSLAARADPGKGAVRYEPARDVSGLKAAGREALRRQLTWRAAQGETGPPPPLNLLALSGGGDGGAFAAGLLNGWTAHGDRPEFDVVTGVSAGAMISPFAFLGPRYDGVLTTIFTHLSRRDVYRERWLLPALFSDSLSDTAPLRRLTRRYVDRRLLDAIAAEHAKGRLLLVSTTNLDTPEPVIWDMGAIAASKDRRALQLFREILLASAAIPGVFPPVMIDVTADGVRYQEMHVDGGTIAQVFAYPPNLRPAEIEASAGVQRPMRLFVIQNARLDPQWAEVARRTLPIANRAVSTLTQAQGLGDLDEIYELAQRDRADYNLAYIPPSFDAPHKEPYDNAYMRALYQAGYQLGASGHPWSKAPPSYLALTPPQQGPRSEAAPQPQPGSAPADRR